MNGISRFTDAGLRLFIILALGAGMALGNVQPTKADGATINVPGDYSTIQLAIDVASPGDTINIAAGTYVENVIVNESVTLAGAGVDTIVQPAVSNPNPCTGSSLCGGLASNVFLVQADNVIIHDLTVDGDNPSLTSGIVKAGGGDPADLDARNGIIKNTNATYNNLEVYNVTVQNIYLRGIYSPGGTFNFHDNTVTNVQGDAYSIGMFAWYGPGTMANNTVSYANDAISANHSNGIQFLNNTVTHSGSGIHTDNSGDAGGVADLIQGNNVDCTDTPAENYGVWVFVPYIGPTYDNNTVTNCEIGFSAWGTGAAVTTQFTNNTLTGPAKATDSVGAYITSSMAGWGYSDVSVNFSGNVITNYETGVFLTANETTWDPGPYAAKTITATLHQNQIYGNTKGAEKDSDGTYIADFTSNWWGDTDPSNDVFGGGIDYAPWYIDAGMTSLIPVHNVTQDTYYPTIQAAISAAASGDTINVAAGTYTETGQIVIDKNLSIVGADKTTTIIKPDSNTGSGSGDAGAWILVNDGITFNLSKVLLDGAGRDIRQAVRYKGSGTVDDVVIQNMVYPGYLGWAIAQGYTSTTAMSLTVTNSTFTNFGRVGILIDEGFGTSTATISGNTFTCKGTGDHLDYAIEVGGGADATITNNTISGCRGVALSDGSTSAAIYVHTYFAPGTTASILDNTLTDSTVGIAVGYDGSDTAVVAAHGNRIFGNDFGVTTTSTTVPVDATNNWWGDNDPSDNVSGTVDYTPWCENEDCNNPPPSLPSSFYGEIHINDSAPVVDDLIEAHIAGVTGPAATAAITSHSGLTYLMNIPADLLGTSAKDGGSEGDLITFKIGTRIVATGFWHSGTNIRLDIHPPQALPGASYSGNEGAAISFSGLANDWGGDANTYEWNWDNTGPYETTGQNPSHTFAQDGIFTVGLKVTDAQGGEGTGTVVVTVTNVPPTVNAGTDFTVAEDASFSFVGAASDVPADLPLTYAWDFDYDGITFDVDATGSLTPSHTYAVVGTHTAALRVTDDNVSVMDTVLVTATNVNDAPEITGQNPISTNEDTSREIAFGDLLVTDPDNTYPAGFSLTVLPGTNYTLVGNTLTPALNFNGALTVPVYVNDGELQSNTYDLTVTVTAVNDAPVANPQTLNTNEDTPLVITLTGSDIESSPLTYAVTVDPEHGILSGTAPNLTYTPALNYNGTDSFKFRVNDGDLNSVEATVSIDVTPVNDAPEITGQSALSTNEDTALTILLGNLTVTDVDNTYPTGFSLTVHDGANYTHVGNIITPTHNFHGLLTVPLHVNDGQADSNTFDLTVTVIDLLPTNVDAYGPYTGLAGQAIALNGTGSCPSMDICTFAWDLDGDGEYDDAAVASPTYIWNTEGNYTIGLRVMDDDGNPVTDTASVVISNATHNLALVPGWNLVSFNVKPTSTAIATVLASLNGNYDLVYAWDASVVSNNWLKYAPSAPPYSNTLSALNEKTGFWIHMTAADTLNVTGSIPGTTTVNLSNVAGGWNLVGFPSSTDVDLPEALSDHGVGIDEFTLVYAYHANDADAWKLFDVDSPSWANDLDFLSPGWGYWVKVDVNTDWSIGY